MARTRAVRDTGVYVEGANTLLRTLSKMGQEASDEVRTASMGLAEQFLRFVNAEAATKPERASAAVMKVYRDRVPKVGFPAGTRTSVSGNPTIGQLFYGTEFGGRKRPTTMQFRESSNTFFGGKGYFFYPALRRHGLGLAEAWFDKIEEVMDTEWNRGATRAEAGGD